MLICEADQRLVKGAKTVMSCRGECLQLASRASPGLASVWCGCYGLVLDWGGLLGWFLVGFGVGSALVAAVAVVWLWTARPGYHSRTCPCPWFSASLQYRGEGGQHIGFLHSPPPREKGLE